MNSIQGLFTHQHSMILECGTDSDCTGDSDKCVSNACFCGSTEKCSETEICSAGECQGM